jgi:peroxiredoxin
MKLFSLSALRSILPVIILSLVFASCGNDKRFTVLGEFSNLPQQRVRLQELRIDDKTVIVDSGTTDANGKFELSTEVTGPGLYQLIFEKGWYIILSQDAGNIKLSGDFNQLPQYTVQGSPASQSIQKFLLVVNEHVRDITTLDNVIRQLHAQGKDSSIASAQQDLSDVSTGLTRYVEQYADTTKYLPNALFAVRILNPATEEPYVNGFLQTLPKRFGNAPQVKEFTERWNKMIAMRQAGGQPQQNFTGGPVMGAAAPPISLPTPDGQTVSLASLKGKYVLVDFWASWCGPCRQENPNVVAAFNKFKDKGFTILGVSLDDNKDKWQQAIQKDGLSWTHISDLKRWESIAARDYGVESIPANFLVDKEGKIVARDLRGPALEQKLAEVLQ